MLQLELPRRSPMIRFAFLGGLVLLLVAELSLAQPPVRSDSAGDPLPADAALRIGSGRFRIVQSGPMAMSPDGKLLAMAIGSGKVSFIDTASGTVTKQVTMDRTNMESLI